MWTYDKIELTSRNIIQLRTNKQISRAKNIVRDNQKNLKFDILYSWKQKLRKIIFCKQKQKQNLIFQEFCNCLVNEMSFYI